MRSRHIQTLVGAAVACALAPNVHAYKLQSGDTHMGDFSAKLQAHHIVDGKDNGYDPDNGASYLLKFKYVTPSFKGFRAGVGSYTNGALLGTTDFSITNPDPSNRIGRGLFVTEDGSSKTLFGEAYVEYKGESFEASGGRMMFNSPLTKIAYSQMPNFYTAFGAKTTAIPDLTLGLHQITEMALGSRARTDFALIGEGTGSAGVVMNPFNQQAEFHSIATISGVAGDTDGITVLNANYKGFEGVNLDFWNYYVDDVANNVYVQADTVFPLSKYKLALSGQYLHQDDTGSNLAGNLDFNLFGVKATLKGKGWAVYGAFNHSTGDTAMLNAWGGDPAYTSSIFSRNAYRENVNAFKVGAKYKMRKDLTFMASYAHYGKSDTATTDRAPGILPKIGGPLTPANDAHEVDMVMVYKPTKNWMIKAFHAIRTSEYDDATPRDLTQGHTRLIASFSF